jgi:hypothetical protein
MRRWDEPQTGPVVALFECPFDSSPRRRDRRGATPAGPNEPAPITDLARIARDQTAARSAARASHAVMTFALSTRRNVSRCSGVSRGRWGRNAGVVATALLVDVELCDVAQEGICVLIDGDLSFSDVGVDLTFARSTQNHC